MKIYIDGGSRGNPGPAAVGVVVFDETKHELHRYGAPIGVRSNNYAEYRALIEALTYLELKKIRKMTTIYSDSELVVRQMNGEYKVKNDTLKALHQKARNLIDRIGTVRIRHIPRSENHIADLIVNRVLDNLPITD